MDQYMRLLPLHWQKQISSIDTSHIRQFFLTVNDKLFLY